MTLHLCHTVTPRHSHLSGEKVVNRGFCYDTTYFTSFVIMAYRRRYRRRYHRRGIRKERQRVVLRSLSIATSTQESWVVYRNTVSGLDALPDTQDRWGLQGHTGKWVGKIKIVFPPTEGPLMWLLVYVPRANSAYYNEGVETVPVATFTNAGQYPVSVYEPNQHVMAMGSSTKEKFGYYIAKGRKLFSGDAIVLIVYNAGDEGVDVSPIVSYSVR